MMLRAWMGAGLLACLVLSPASAHEIELGGGVLVPMRGEDRDLYGALPGSGVGLALDLKPGTSWVVLEAAWNADTRPGPLDDPTFDQPRPRLWLFPLALGVRGDVVPERYRGTVSLRVGVGFVTVPAVFRDPNRDTHGGIGWGVRAEFGPSVRIADRVSLWARQSLEVGTEVDLGPEAYHLSGIGLRAGLSYRTGEEP